MKTIKVKSLQVPIEVMTQVADLINEHELSAEVIGSSANYEDTIVIDFSYEREEREAIREIESLIEDHLEDEDDENDEDEDE